MRDICDIYERSNVVTLDLEELLCFLVDSETLNYEEAMKMNCWRQAMEECEWRTNSSQGP